MQEDRTGKIRSLPMSANRMLSFSMACCEATGIEPAASGQTRRGRDLVHAHPSVGALLVGKIGGQSDMGNRPAGTSKPIGTWPEKWTDCVHELDGHSIDVEPAERSGERELEKELLSLYIQHGIEEAVDDVSGAILDPALVKAGREVEMGSLRT